MNILTYTLLALLVAAIAFFAYVSFTDFEVQQTEVVKEIDVSANF